MILIDNDAIPQDTVIRNQAYTATDITIQQYPQQQPSVSSPSEYVQSNPTIVDHVITLEVP